MEFSPAHAAYQNVSRTGFRTFCKTDGAYRELFTGACGMHIGMSEVEITCRESGLEASALYFGVPGERTAALARVLTVRNTEKAPVTLELLDGMPALVPYGVEQDALKNMANLAKAWMQAEDADTGRTCFRVRASMADTAQVTEGFLRMPLEELCALPQMTENHFPCCFLPRKTVLQPGEAVGVFSLYGQAEDKGRVAALAERVTGGEWFEAKRREAKELAEALCAPSRPEPPVQRLVRPRDRRVGHPYLF